MARLDVADRLLESTGSRAAARCSRTSSTAMNSKKKLTTGLNSGLPLNPLAQLGVLGGDARPGRVSGGWQTAHHDAAGQTTSGLADAEAELLGAEQRLLRDDDVAARSSGWPSTWTLIRSR